MDAPKPKRRRFRFSLRTLLIATALVGLLMGWIVKERNQSQLEQQAVEELQKQGGTAVSFKSGGPYDSLEGLNNPSWWRSLIQWVLGKRIYTLAIHGDNCKDLTPLTGLKSLESLVLIASPATDLRPLAGLTTLQHLNLNRAIVSDISPLAGLKNLNSLGIGGTNVRDVTPLAGLKNLEGVSLAQAHISDLTPFAGMLKLRSLNLWHTQVSDLTPLAGLKNLTSINVQYTAVSAEQAEALQQALPKCRIVR